MSNDIIKPNQALDNFGDFDESVEGDEGRAGSLLVGMRLSFDQAKWTAVSGEDFTDRILLATNIRRTEVKWGVEENRPPVEVRELQPGQKFRDLKALNEKCPQTEWRMSFGHLRGPWERQYVVEFADLETMARFSWPSSTAGGGICVRELVDCTLLKRKFEKRNALWPLVKLSHCFMKTQWKGRERPELKIVDWYPPKEAVATIEAAPAPKQLPPAAEPAPPAPTPGPVSKPAPAQAAKPATLSEEMGGDVVPF